MILVCNTGLLIALGKLDKLPLLNGLGFDRVLIPGRVHRELWGRIAKESAAIDSALNDFIQVEKVPATEENPETSLTNLDQGEKEVILLGTALTEDVLLLLDDQAGRKAARQKALPVIGTAGLLLLAKQHGLIDTVSPMLIALRQRGYWLSDAFIVEIRKLAKE